MKNPTGKIKNHSRVHSKNVYSAMVRRKNILGHNKAAKAYNALNDN